MAIYFLRDLATGYLKIGYSANIRRRVAALQASSPSGTALVAWMEGDKEVERSLHERFANERAHREWFRPSADLTSFVEHIAQEEPPAPPPQPAEVRSTLAPCAAARGPLSGRELLEWRVKVGMSRKEAAAYLGFSWRTIENWENERRPVAHPRGLRTMMDLMSKRLGL